MQQYTINLISNLDEPYKLGISLQVDYPNELEFPIWDSDLLDYLTEELTSDFESHDNFELAKNAILNGFYVVQNEKGDVLYNPIVLEDVDKDVRPKDCKLEDTSVPKQPLKENSGIIEEPNKEPIETMSTQTVMSPETLNGVSTDYSTTAMRIAAEYKKAHGVVSKLEDAIKNTEQTIKSATTAFKSAETRLKNALQQQEEKEKEMETQLARLNTLKQEAKTLLNTPNIPQSVLTAFSLVDMNLDDDGTPED